MHEGEGALSAPVVMVVLREKEREKPGLCASRGVQSVGAAAARVRLYLVCIQAFRRLRVPRKHSRGRPFALLTALIGYRLLGETYMGPRRLYVFFLRACVRWQPLSVCVFVRGSALDSYRVCAWYLRETLGGLARTVYFRRHYMRERSTAAAACTR